METDSKKFPRFLPCLWDNLVDEEPEKKSEPVAQRALGPRRYREAVARDIQRLLNSASPFSESELSDLPHVSNSIYNYGMRNFTGNQMSSMSRNEIIENIRRTLSRFEPRLIMETLEVHTTYNRDASKRINLLSFEISGRIWAVPFPEDLYLYTELDLETGSFRVDQR